VLAATLEGADADGLRETMDKLKDKLKSAAIVLASVGDGKVSLIAGVTADLTGKVKAGELVNFVAQQVGGKGGGRPDMAQAGGTEPAPCRRRWLRLPRRLAQVLHGFAFADHFALDDVAIGRPLLRLLLHLILHLLAHGARLPPQPAAEQDGGYRDHRQRGEREHESEDGGDDGADEAEHPPGKASGLPGMTGIELTELLLLFAHDARFAFRFRVTSLQSSENWPGPVCARVPFL
jgi:hypothetical protein